MKSIQPRLASISELHRWWLDADVFIQAKNGLYAFDINRTFWNWLDEQLRNGVIACPKMVYKEIVDNQRITDKLAEWVKARQKKGLCVKPDATVQAAATEIGNYVFTRYDYANAWDFSRGGDAWVIAHAMCDKGTVVTNESAERPTAKKARIPDVCSYFEVACADTVKMLRMLKAQL